MKRFEEGDKGRAVCDACGSVVPTTFAYRDVPFSDGAGIAKSILVAACDRCGMVVATPPQSTPAIHRARRDAAVPVEARMPAPALEILDLALYRLDSAATSEFRKALLVFHASELASSDRMRDRVKTLSSRYEALRTKHKKAPMRRLSFKVSERAYAPMKALMDGAAISRTDMLGSLIMKIDQEIVQPEEVSRSTAFPEWVRALYG